MAIFFVTPYTKYYEELSAATGIVGKASELAGSASTLSTTIGKLQSQLDASEWKELGQEQLVTVTIPAFKDRVDKFKSNITNGLQAACTESINTLLPLVTTLKEKDELYEKKLEELNNLKEPSPKYETTTRNGKTVDTGELTSAYKEYEKKKKELTDLVEQLKKELEELIVTIDATVESIKALNGSVVSFGAVSAKDEKEDTTEETVETEAIEEIEGLTLTQQEEEYVEAVTAAVEEAENKGDENLTSLLGTGQTLLLNDEGSKEEGYSRKIVTSHGKVVTVFQQGWNENLQFVDTGKTLRSAGCGYNALASILSSKYDDVTPEKVFVAMGQKFMYAGSIKTFLENQLGIPVGTRDEVSRNDYSAYREHLTTEVSKGNMVMVTVDARYNNKYTNNNHWVAIVDYDAETDQFYISDSADTNDDNAAPIDVDTFLKKYSVNTNVIYIADTSGYKG